MRKHFIAIGKKKYIAYKRGLFIMREHGENVSIEIIGIGKVN